MNVRGMSLKVPRFWGFTVVACRESSEKRAGYNSLQPQEYRGDPREGHSDIALDNLKIALG
jgi:hypothetical protein